MIKVGISDIQFIQAPDRIKTSGLGSCVGIVMYDSGKQIAGLAHIMLPDSTQMTQKLINRAKYADTAVDSLIEGMMERGASFSRLKAKIAGGAQMFAYSNTTDVMRIGSRNIEAVQLALANKRIPIIASDVGGHSGRTIEFDPLTNQLKIKSVHKEAYYI